MMIDERKFLARQGHSTLDVDANAQSKLPPECHICGETWKHSWPDSEDAHHATICYGCWCDRNTARKAVRKQDVGEI